MLLPKLVFNARFKAGSASMPLVREYRLLAIHMHVWYLWSMLMLHRENAPLPLNLYLVVRMSKKVFQSFSAAHYFFWYIVPKIFRKRRCVTVAKRSSYSGCNVFGGPMHCVKVRRHSQPQACIAVGATSLWDDVP